MNTISIVDLEIICIIGILPKERIEEQKEPQSILIINDNNMNDNIQPKVEIKDTTNLEDLDLRMFNNLDNNMDEVLINKGVKINLCIYNINTTYETPYLQYLLYKYDK